MLYLNLNGSINKLFINGYVGIELKGNEVPYLIDEVLRGWEEFKKMQDWEKDYYLFDSYDRNSQHTPGSPGFFRYPYEAKGQEYLYFNKYYETRLRSNEIDYNIHKSFFASIKKLKGILYNSALEIAKGIDSCNKPMGISCEQVIKDKKDISCLRLASSYSEAYEMSDPFRKKYFFLGLQLYLIKGNLRLLSYFGKHAMGQSNGILRNQYEEFALYGNEEIVPICSLF